MDAFKEAVKLFSLDSAICALAVVSGGIKKQQQQQQQQLTTPRAVAQKNQR